MENKGCKNETISVIVPVYNVEAYIAECIESLVVQTYKNIEIILIDDGSKDDSGRICDDWAVRDSRIKVVHIKNQGVSHARNVGLKRATGRYIGFVDADDWVEPDFYEILIRGIIDNNTDAAGSGYTREEKTGGVVTLRKGMPKVFSRGEILQEIFSCNIPKLLYWELCDKLFKKELITNIYLDESIAVGEDMLFFWQIMKRAERFAYVPSYKYHYRMREGSAVHSGISEKSISSFKAVQMIWESAQEEDDDDGLQHTIFRHYLTSAISITRQMLVYDVEGYEKAIKDNQKLIRQNWREIVCMNNLSARAVIGTFFLCLPFALCRNMLCFIKKKSD